MKKLGILVPLVTPCTRTGAIDEAGLRGVCRDVLGAGCHSVFVAGSTGRGPWFARQDRVRICRTVVEEVGKDVIVFAGCMAPGLTDMVENAQALAAAGAQIAVVTAPGYFSYSQAEVELVFRQFADRARSEAGWTCYELDTSHNPHITCPNEFMTLLTKIMAGGK